MHQDHVVGAPNAVQLQRGGIAEDADLLVAPEQVRDRGHPLGVVVLDLDGLAAQTIYDNAAIGVCPPLERFASRLMALPLENKVALLNGPLLCHIFPAC